MAPVYGFETLELDPPEHPLLRNGTPSLAPQAGGDLRQAQVETPAAGDTPSSDPPRLG